MCKRLWCVYVLSKKQDVNLFVVDGRRHGPLLSKAKGDPASLLVQHIHQCAKMLARGHAGTFILKNRQNLVLCTTQFYQTCTSFVQLEQLFVLYATLGTWRRLGKLCKKMTFIFTMIFSMVP